MKNVLFIFIILLGGSANAQNYLLSFAGSGAANTVSTVNVENLTSGGSALLNGGDILCLTGIVDINEPEKNASGVKIYPNPFTESATIEFYIPISGDVTINIFEMTGKLIYQLHNYLDIGVHEYSLIGLRRGLYIISIRGDAFQLSGKIISNSRISGELRMEMTGNSHIVDEKSEEQAKGSQTTIYMSYSSGDKLKFTGVSGLYSTTKTESPTQSKTIIFNFLDTKDGDNNIYPVVEIGSQIWLTENLKTTKYLNGDNIGTTNPDDLDLSAESIPKYQWAYGGDEINVARYGRIYTWYSITDNRAVCPLGWHIPLDADWTDLIVYLKDNGYSQGGSGDDIAKSLAATSGWLESDEYGTVGYNQSVNNASGFNARPGGVRSFMGTAGLIGEYAYWWTATAYDINDSWYWLLGYYSGVIDRYHESKKSNGGSVRCIKNQ